VREYTDTRVAAMDPTKIDMVVLRSAQIQNELWAMAEEIAIENPE
jgi:hypothetical protein